MWYVYSSHHFPLYLLRILHSLVIVCACLNLIMLQLIETFQPSTLEDGTEYAGLDPKDIREEVTDIFKRSQQSRYESLSFFDLLVPSLSLRVTLVLMPPLRCKRDKRSRAKSGSSDGRPNGKLQCVPTVNFLRRANDTSNNYISWSLQAEDKGEEKKLVPSTAAVASAAVLKTLWSSRLLLPSSLLLLKQLKQQLSRWARSALAGC